MSAEADAEKVEDFALEVVRAGPDGGDGFEGGTAAVEANLQADALFFRNREQVVHDFETRLLRMPVDAGDVRKVVERAIRVVTQKRAGFADGGALDVEGHLVAIVLDAFDG